MKNTAPERRILGIYYDKDHHPYFYHSKSRSAYFIPERDIKMAEVVAYRHWIAIAVGVVLYTLFQGTPLYAFAVSALLFVSLEWFYRQKMVKKYKKISPFIPHQNARSKAMNAVLVAMIGITIVSGIQNLILLIKKNR